MKFIKFGYFLLLYIRCAFANAFVRVGYLLILLGAVCAYLEVRAGHTTAWLLLDFAFGLVGVLLLAATRLGISTLATYLRTRSHYIQHETLDRRFIEAMYYAPYCTMQGFLLAIKDINKSRKTKGAPE